jgi:hypothetical protein
MWVQPVIFSAPKQGYQPSWWEDGGGYGAGIDAVRFAVADGATEGYESRRWVSHLLDSFLTADHPDTPGGLDEGSLRTWLRRMQDTWSCGIPPTTDYIDQVKIQEGAFATFVGCQLDGLDGMAPPRWHAAAVGDAVLFHVRGGRLLRHLPPLRAADFGTAPDGLSSKPNRLAGIVKQLRFDNGTLAPGDLLFAATDAMAKWMLTWFEKDEQRLWTALAALADPADFDHLVGEQRQAKAMKDDDVTLLRVRLMSKPAEMLVVPR